MVRAPFGLRSALSDIHLLCCCPAGSSLLRRAFPLGLKICKLSGSSIKVFVLLAMKDRFGMR